MRALAAVLLVTACANSSGPVLGFDRQPIIGGTPAQTGQYPTVVAVIQPTIGSLCTGTLISPTAILTAAHCVDPTELQSTAAKVLADTIVQFDSTVADAQSGQIIAAKTIYENPKHPNFGSANPDFGHDDDSIIILSQAVTDRAPSPLDLDATRNLVGVETVQVGYGIDKLKNGSADQTAGGDENVLTNAKVVDCAPYQLSNTNMICFDQTGDKGQCNGDSGGPTFDPDGKVIGATSFGDDGCVQWGADTRPSQTADFIRANVPDLPATAATPTCGNGVVDPGETCDDGAANGTSGDPCSSTCTAVGGGGDPTGGGGDPTGGGGTPTSSSVTSIGNCSAGGMPGFGTALAALGLVWQRRRRGYRSEA